MNQVGLVGRLTKDPVLRKLSEGRIHTSFTLAINRNYRSNEGTVEADFVLCTAWGKLAERIVEYCGKGSLVGVDGRLQTRTYTNKDNVRMYSTEVLIDDVRFYVLKTPAKKGTNEKKMSEGSKIAETIARNGFGEDRQHANRFPNGSNELTSEFELPKTEDTFPVR